MKAVDFLAKIEGEFNDLYDFMEYVDQENFLKENEIVFVENLDEDISDSYGWTDEILKRVYRHVPTGNFFMVKGTNASYQGTKWDTIIDVEPKEKKTIVYE